MLNMVARRGKRRDPGACAQWGGGGGGGHLTPQEVGISPAEGSARVGSLNPLAYFFRGRKVSDVLCQRKYQSSTRKECGKVQDRDATRDL